MRIFIRGILFKLGLLKTARFAFRNTVGFLKDALWHLSKGSTVTTDENPVPPPSLCFLSAASYDPPHFISTGRVGAEAIKDLLETVGKPLESFSSILDFGCGCCRIARHFLPLWNGASISGIDVNRRSVKWSERNLPDFRISGYRQGDPLPYPSGQFDLVLAVAVFPLLNAEHQYYYFEEIRRVLSPQGIFMVTLKNSERKYELSPDEASGFDAGQAVIREPEYSGSLYCLAYHPEEMVKNVLAFDFSVIRHEKRGSTDTSQDAWLLQPYPDISHPL